MKAEAGITRYPTMALLAAMLASIAVAATTGLYMLITGDDSDEAGSLVGAAVIAVLHFGGAMMATLVIRRARLELLMWHAVLAAAVAMLFWTLAIYEVGATRRAQATLFQIAASATLFMVAALQAGRMACLNPHSQALRVARWFTAVLFMIVALAIICLIWLGDDLERLLPDAVLMLIGTSVTAGAALSLFATLVVPILVQAELRRRTVTEESVSLRARLELNCPRCAAPLRLAPGPGRCGACGFTMIIEVEEPRCECGYLLYRLAGDTCPECGRTIGPPSPPASTSQLSAESA